MIRRWLDERRRINDLLAEMDAQMPGRLDRLDWATSHAPHRQNGWHTQAV